MKNLIIASTSTLHGGDYLEYLLPELSIHFKDCKTLVFVPFARPGGISHDDYTAKVATAFNTIGIAVKGVHAFRESFRSHSMKAGRDFYRRRQYFFIGN